jgi:hypothetical protein
MTSEEQVSSFLGVQGQNSRHQAREALECPMAPNVAVNILTSGPLPSLQK